MSAARRGLIHASKEAGRAGLSLDVVNEFPREQGGQGFADGGHEKGPGRPLPGGPPRSKMSPLPQRAHGGIVPLMARVLVPLAPGVEELEAVTIIDLLRRAGVEVVVAGIEPGPIRGSRGVVLVPDVLLTDVATEAFDLVALPGGLEGSRRLAESTWVREALRRAVDAGRRVAAICAAPEVLRRAGLLQGRRVTSYPGVLPMDDESYTYVDDCVVVDGPVTTSRGPGTAMDFALCLIEQLSGGELRARVESGLVRPLEKAAE